MKRWKEIKGYEGLYLISDTGDIVGLKRGIQHPSTTKDGYLRTALCKNGIMKSFYVHRLVADNFIDNPQNLPAVNHKDENKKNNAVDNLEWCEIDYNNVYGTRVARAAKSRTGKRMVSIIQRDADGTFIKKWDGIVCACVALGIQKSSIQKCMKGTQKLAGGFKWERA